METTTPEIAVTPVDAHAHGPSGLLGDTTFYVLISFIIFCLLAYKFGRASVTSGLDAKITRIQNELEAASATRRAAETLLQEAKQKAADIATDTKRIVDQATADAAALRAQAAAELDADMTRREAALASRLQRMRDEAQADLQAYAATLVVQSAEQIVTQAVNEKTHAQLVKATTESLPTTLKKANTKAA